VFTQKFNNTYKRNNGKTTGMTPQWSSGTLSQQWQFNFTVKGLVAPIEGLTFGNMQIKGLSADNAQVSFREQIEPSTHQAKSLELQRKLTNIAGLYGLVTNTYFAIQNSTQEQVSKDGSLKVLIFTISTIPAPSDDERAKNISCIEKTLEKYDAFQAIYSKQEKFFLRNAIDYYARSLRDDLLEEKLLDLMISLESLFSREKDELGLRYSLRLFRLLNAGEEKDNSEIFKIVHKLYGKRSEVVHGSSKVKLDYNDLSLFQEYVSEAIKRFMYIKASKDEILDMLDASLTDEDKRQTLNKIVKAAREKW
jgi:hypothetical protein